MNDEIKKYYDEVLLHRSYVIEVSKILCDYLIDNQQHEIAYCLRNRCLIHDESKFSKEEMEAFMSIKDKEDFKNPNVLLSEEKIEAIKLHWQHNSHHPEFYSNIYNMTDLDLMEMACDCFARSIQYNTDFLEFILIRQNNRFKFPEDIFKKYYRYCKILSDGYKKEKEIKVKKKTK